MKFGDLFSNTWKDFKEAFDNILKANFWLVLFPYLVIMLFLLLSTFFSGIFDDLRNIISASSQNVGEEVISIIAFGFIVKLFFILAVASLLTTMAFFLALFAYLCTLSLKKGESFKDLKKRVQPHYWRFVGVIFLVMLILIGIVLSLFIVLAPLFLVLMSIPSLNTFIFIIEILLYILIVFFSVRFIFAPYILVHENKKVIESIKESWKITGKSWLKIFGYLFLIFLIYSVIGTIFYVFALVIMILIAAPAFSSIIQVGAQPTFEQIWSLLAPIFTILGVIYLIYIVITYLVIIPFVILFIKNIYLDLKKKRKA